MGATLKVDSISHRKRWTPSPRWRPSKLIMPYHIIIRSAGSKFPLTAQNKTTNLFDAMETNIFHIASPPDFLDTGLVSAQDKTHPLDKSNALTSNFCKGMARHAPTVLIPAGINRDGSRTVLTSNRRDEVASPDKTSNRRGEPPRSPNRIRAYAIRPYIAPSFRCPSPSPREKVARSAG